MLMPYWGGPALVKAYSLELLVDAARQHRASRPQPSPRRLSVAFGRALCGTGSTLVVRVELRKGDVLYLNDGSFGNMFTRSDVHAIIKIL